MILATRDGLRGYRHTLQARPVCRFDTLRPAFCVYSLARSFICHAVHIIDWCPQGNAGRDMVVRVVASTMPVNAGKDYVWCLP